ncbi:MAG TPA: DUF1566 domain-containing protein [Rhodocyclaceae bacterium]|nr:DUF1566 domain-containing protein [Rhodocyclaceae bacterium]
MNSLAYKFRVSTTWLRYLCVLCPLISAAQAKTYSDNGDGTVTDPTTGLTWMRCAMGQMWDGSTCVGEVKKYTYDEAMALAGKVRFTGRNNWRLPNIRELQTLVDRSVVNPAIDKMAFPSTPSKFFWSGTPDMDFAWYVDFSSGLAYYGHRSYDYSVRLVRGGQSNGLLNADRPSSDYIDHGDGTVEHTPTGLVWKRCAEGETWTGSACSGSASKYTWEAANLLSSNFVGKTDWRLPNIDELLSLIDYTKRRPALNEVIFQGKTTGLCFWSGSRYANDASEAWCVRFDKGADYLDFLVKNDNPVRMVRGGKPVGILSLSIDKTGPGKISSMVAGIDCGDKCSEYYVKGTKILLSARSAATIIWGGACIGAAPTCKVTMNAARKVTVHFIRRPKSRVDGRDLPNLAFSTSSLSFSAQKPGSISAPENVTITNIGRAALDLRSIVASGDYAVSHNCSMVLKAGELCNLSVAFAPTQAGTRGGYVLIVSNAAESPHAMVLSGVVLESGGVTGRGESVIE